MIRIEESLAAPTETTTKMIEMTQEEEMPIAQGLIETTEMIGDSRIQEGQTMTRRDLLIPNGRMTNTNPSSTVTGMRGMEEIIETIGAIETGMAKEGTKTPIEYQSK